MGTYPSPHIVCPDMNVMEMRIALKRAVDVKPYGILESVPFWQLQPYTSIVTFNILPRA